MQRLKNNDRGQSGTVVALLMVPIMAMLALALDVGAMHLEKQQLQTGADAGALAIAQDCAHHDCSTATHTASAMAAANFHGEDASGTVVSLNEAERTVTVRTNTLRDHWFAPIIGIHSTPIEATATATWTEPLGTASFFPLALSSCALADSGGHSGGPQTIVTNDSSSCMGPEGMMPGGFGWLTPADSNCEQLAWDDHGWADADSGNNVPSACSPADFQRLTGQTILVPVFDDTTGQGSSGQYRIAEFVEFTLSDYSFTGQFKSANPPCKGNTHCIRGTINQRIPLSDATTGGSTAALVSLTE